MTCHASHPLSERSAIEGRLAEVFRSISADKWSELAEGASVQEISEGQVLIHEGMKPSGVFMVMQGRFGIFTQDSSAHVAHVRAVTEPGTFLGEQSFRTGRRFANATVIALTQGRVAFIGAEVFRELISSDAEAAARFDEAGRVQSLEKLRALSAELAAVTGTGGSGAPTSRQFSAGDAVYRAGETGSAAFFILSGQINLLPPGCPVPHETLGPGIIFGETEAASHLPRRYNAVAGTAAELLEIPGEVLQVGQQAGPEVGTVLKALAFVHDMPRLGTAYRFLGQADGQSCIVTDYSQAGGRRVRVRYFSHNQMVEVGTVEADGAREIVNTPDGSASLLLSKGDSRVAGLRARHDWPGLPEAMAVLLRGGSLENWQIAALRSDGIWMAEAASERAIGGSEVVCACTNATVTRLRLAAQGVETVEELMRRTGAGTVCGGCRSRLPLMLGEEESLLCHLETEAICAGSVRACLVPAVDGVLPVALPGQHVRVEALLDERWVGRPYTLTAFGPAKYELGVKIEEGGLLSNWICHAPQGSLVRVSPPQGTICPRADDPRSLLYIVAGIGVTTAMAAVRALAGSRPIVVYFVYREEADAPYLAELREEARQHRIELEEIMTSEAGRPSLEFWKQSLSQRGPCEAIICGPEDFNRDMLSVCKGLEGIQPIAESFLHPQRGEGAVPKPGSWRIPGFSAACPANMAAPVKSKLPAAEEASLFLAQYFYESFPGSDATERIREVQDAIASTGTWRQTTDELGFAARIAWRNAERCVGRLYWKGLHLRDCRHLTTAAEIAEAIFDHLRFAFNGGDLRPAISVFAPDGPERPGPRIWNPQLLRYAGTRLRSGKQIGDPAQNELTQRIAKLGWEPRGTHFDLLPLVLELPGEQPQLFELPADCRQETLITHPQHPWVGDMGLRWHCIPAVSDMMLDAGGVHYRLAPFNGWYLDTEIAARNFTDTNRYNLLPAVAEEMGLDISQDRTLWRDKAMIVLNEAVLHSFDKDGVKISDHHAVGHEFLEFCRNEQKAGREPYGKWMWLVPPMSSSASVLYQEPFRDISIKPAFRYQKAVWQGRPI